MNPVLLELLAHEHDRERSARLEDPHRVRPVHLRPTAHPLRPLGELLIRVGVRLSGGDQSALSRRGAHLPLA